MSNVDAAAIVREARLRAGMSLRDLARRAGTSHSAVAAYEAGRRSPTTATLDRILRAAGFALDVTLSRRVFGDKVDRGVELEEVLGAAEEFPARHSGDPRMPVFGRNTDGSGR